MTEHGIFAPWPRRYILAALATWLTGWLPGQTVLAAGAGPPAAGTVLDEVLVRAKRVRIDELRREVIRLEDQLYARYNDVNRIGRFDIVCSDDARTGTRIERRYCRPKFEDTAKAEEGQVAFLSIAQVHDPYAPVPAASVQLPDSPVPKIMAQVPHFQRHMRQIMQEDQQLQQLLQERAAAQERLQRAQRELFDR